MDDPQVWIESVKGIWSILAIVFTGVITWIGWSIKERIDRKKRDTEYRETMEKSIRELSEKIDESSEFQRENVKRTNKKLNSISAGLELCMEDDAIMFEAFRKSHMLNGESEAQSRKLETYRKNLMHESLGVNDDELS